MVDSTRPAQPAEVEELPDRLLTIPNLLSVVRLALVPVFLWLLLGPQADGWALLILVYAGISDWADGKIARWLNQASRLGAMLDPAADRLYTLATVVAFVRARHHAVVDRARCSCCATSSSPSASGCCAATASARPR